MSKQSKNKVINNRSNSLKGLITLSRIGRILSIIAFVVGIVVAVASAVVFIYSYVGKDIQLAIFDNKTLEVFIKGIFPKDFGYYNIPMYAGMSFCGGVVEALLASRAMNYFKHVVYADTPFTLRGSKELLRLGIASFIAFGILVVCNTVFYLVFTNLYQNMGPVFVSVSPVGFGIAFTVISVITRYGAEQNRKITLLQEDDK